MSPQATALETEALKLDLAERARLAETLLLSLDAPSEEENLQLWVHEAERRLGDLRSGRARERSVTAVFRRAMASLE
jgi:hypothetical protein